MASRPLINFFQGHPSQSLLPRKELAAAFEKVLLHTDYVDYANDPLNRPPLTYGTDQGNYDTRKVISRWLDDHFGRNTPTDPDTVNLTGGASYGIANILASLTDPTTVTKQIFVVSPTYFLINYALVDAGYADKLTAIAETGGGEYDIDLADLEEKLQHYDQGLEPAGGAEINVFDDPTGRPTQKKYRYVIYVVPTYSNPGALNYSTKTRQKLVQIARKHDMLILSDDVYDFLHYDADVSLPPKLVHLDRDTLPENFTFGNTLSNSSFSKLIAPGLRVGWQESATKKLLQQLAITGANKSGGTPGQLNSLVVQHLIETGSIEKVIANFRENYKERAAAVKAAVKEHLPVKYTTLYGGDGGYFLWVAIRAPNYDHRGVLAKLKQEFNVVIPGGDHFEVHGDHRGWGDFGVRLCISLLTSENIKEGISRWGEVLKRENPELYK